MQTETRTGVRNRILDAIVDSPTPLTAREIVAKTNVSPNGVYVELHRLRAARKINCRHRAAKGPGCALKEYFATPPSELPTRLEDYEDEIPDHVWWAEQERRGFKRPAHVNIIYSCDPTSPTRV